MMFVLIRGAGDSAWYWHLVQPQLGDRGHEVVAMDLPCDDDFAGLTEYADSVIDSNGNHRKAWPDVPARVLSCRDDRVFPVDWLRGVVKERLGITPDDIDGGHCIALSRPKELADRFHDSLA